MDKVLWFLVGAIIAVAVFVMICWIADAIYARVMYGPKR